MKGLTENKFLTDQELDQLLATCEKHQGRDSIILRFTLFTGARGCEVRKVRKLDLAKCAVAIHGAKGSNNRVVPLPAKFFKELSDYARDMGDDDLLFPVAERTLRWIWEQYRPNRKKGIHCLRHSFGVRLYLNCEDIHAVKTALGHKNIQNTMVYLDFIEGQRKLKRATNGMWKGRLDEVA